MRNKNIFFFIILVFSFLILIQSISASSISVSPYGLVKVEQWEETNVINNLNLNVSSWIKVNINKSIKSRKENIVHNNQIPEDKIITKNELLSHI